MKKRICGVYKIENLINHKVYIGQSIDIYKRWKEHIYSSKYTSNGNKHFYNALKKYGTDKFSFEILKETKDLDYWEIFLIQLYRSTNPKYGYNISSGGQGNRHNRYHKYSQPNRRIYIYCLETGETLYKKEWVNLGYTGLNLGKNSKEYQLCKEKHFIVKNNFTEQEIKDLKQNIELLDKKKQKEFILKQKLNSSKEFYLNLDTKEIKYRREWSDLKFNFSKGFQFKNKIIYYARNNYFIKVPSKDYDIIPLIKELPDIICYHKNDIYNKRVKAGKYKKPFSEEHKQHLKESRKRQVIPMRTRIQCVETKEVHSATEWKNLGYREAGAVARGIQHTCKGFHFISLPL